MDENEKEITVFPSVWFNGAEELITKTLPPDEDHADEIAWIQNQIESNRFTLFRVLEDGELAGVFTTRWAKMFDGTKRLVIIHGAAVDESRNFLRLVQHPVKQIAKDLKCDALEIHIRRKGLAHQLKVDGYDFQESIYTRKVM